MKEGINVAIVWLYGVLLLIAYSGPTLLALSAYTYGITTLAHFVTFLVSVILFVMMGKSLKKRRRRRFSTGLLVGGAVAVLGTGIGQIIRRSPAAERAFIAQVPKVPPQAALTMLHLHALVSAILSGIIFAVLFGLLGAIATWWGGRGQAPMTPEDPAEHGRAG